LPLRPWGECLELDWPHAIGTDEQGPLIWQTAPHDDWKTLMRTLAIIKIGLRTQFRFAKREKAQSQEKGHAPKNGKPPEKRHWLSYPVTNHQVDDWGGLRLPNSLRFKVRKSADGRLVGVIFHMPCSPPATFKPDRKALREVWKCVHKFLDALCLPSAQRDYSETADPGVLAKQAEQLAEVSLLRAEE
jgi:CRISPR-associated protein Cmr1